jgi:hypothetical protein
MLCCRRGNEGDHATANRQPRWCPAEIEQSGMDSPPQAFEHASVVPGLADMAQPGFKGVGKKSELRQAFWYRRSFVIPGAEPDVALLKIHKARYGTRVFLNGVQVGDHLPCFKPALLDIKPLMRGGGQENELVTRVGADHSCLPLEQYTMVAEITDEAGKPVRSLRVFKVKLAQVRHRMRWCYNRSP